MAQESLAMATTQSKSLNESTAVSREMATVQGAIFMAKQFPRDIVAAENRIISACRRPKLAMEAIYKYAKGGTNIEGPSIRLAEAMAQSWGNIEYGVQELEQVNGESIVQAYAWDLETNTRQTKRFTVPHIRHTKKGDYPLTDPREIYELIANNGARRVRACILGVIPGDIAESAVEECRKTQTRSVEVTEESRSRLIQAFANYGVTIEMIEARIQRKISAIDPYFLNDLRTIYTALKDEMGTVEDYFDTSVVRPQEGLVEKNKRKGQPTKERDPKEQAEKEDVSNLFPNSEDTDF